MITNHANRIHVYQDISDPFNQAHGPESIEGQNISNQVEEVDQNIRVPVGKVSGYQVIRENLLIADC